MAERVTENVYRLGAVTVDTKARTVTCPGVVNMERGAIEYLAVAPGGKLHESLLRLDARPLHLHLALLMLDLEPKNGLTRQGDRRVPQGPPLEIRVRWRNAKGVEKTVRAEDLVQEMPKGGAMGRGAWAFTGSRVLREGFEADLTKSVAAVWRDPAALIDNRLPGGASNAYVVYAGRVPKRGTPVEFVIQPALRGANGARKDKDAP